MHSERIDERLYSVARGDGSVEAWCTVRLPFEPKGWLRDYRSELQSALRSTDAAPAGVLYAEYSAPDAAYADLENVLLYNVGSGCYSHLAHRGIVCRRLPSADHLHHVRYASVEPTEITMPRGPTLATAQLAAMPSGNTPAHWWAAFRERLQTPGGTPHAGEFGVRAEVGSAWRRTLAPSVKTMLDGLVAALHVHDGSERDHVSVALSEVGEGEVLWELLNDPAIAIFGQRRLVRSHGSKIAWNPADERCGYIEVLRGSGKDAVTVAIFAL